MIEKREFRDQLKDFTKAISSKCYYSSALGMERQYLTIRTGSKTQSVDENTLGSGIVFRAYDGNTFNELSTSNLGKNELYRDFKGFSQLLGNGNIIPELSIPLIGTKDFATPVIIDPETVPLDDKLEMINELKYLLLELDEYIKDVQITYRESKESSVFVDDANDVFQNIISTELQIIVFSNVKSKTVFEAYSRGGAAGFENISLTAQELEKLKNNLRALYYTQFISPGTFNVIASPLTSGIIAHESFGHGVEMDLFLKRKARASLYMNKNVASSLVTMKDDPSLPGGYGTYFFDDEGILARPTTIIGCGMLLSGLSDIQSSYKLGTRTTGNGRRESYSRKVYSRMSNTFIEPGNTTLDELMSEAGEGIYLESPSGGIEDPQGWGIQVTVKIGREFKKGRFTGKVFSPISVTGYVPDLLQSIKGIGSDFKIFPGFCGKGYKEMIKVGLGGPHILARCRLG